MALRGVQETYYDNLSAFVRSLMILLEIAAISKEN